MFLALRGTWRAAKSYYVILSVCLCLLAVAYMLLALRWMWPAQTCVDEIQRKDWPDAQDPTLADIATTTASRPPGPCPGVAEQYERFCVLKYWETRSRSDVEDPDVTLCTQSTPEYLHHLLTQCQRWLGPISAAVYVSSQDDFVVARRAISTMRRCSGCVAEWVDWHILFDVNVSIAMEAFPREPDDNCSYPAQLKGLLSKRNGTYPINAARNVARESTETSHVLLIDIELYPSLNVRPRFNLMMSAAYTADRFETNRVYVLPVFEVWSKYEAPETKQQLRDMFYKKQAILFHKFRCRVCHEIPGLREWINSSSTDGATAAGAADEEARPLRVWRTVKRNKHFGLLEWKPFFIGTTSDPRFDTKLSWEGKANKMQVAYEMCLMDYDFSILDDAFLVHAPGVNVYSKKKETFRMAHAVQNTALLKTIKKELRKKFRVDRDC